MNTIFKTETISLFLMIPLLLSAGCSDDSSSGAADDTETSVEGDSDSDSDTDADTDSDSDTDSDTESDTDTDPLDTDIPGWENDLDDCPAYTPGLNLDVCTATYITGSANDGSGGIAISPAGAVVFAGALGPAALSATPGEFLAGGPHGVTILSMSGRRLIGSLALGAEATDVAVAENGKIAVTGDFGVAMISADASELLWSRTLSGGTGTRVSVGENGDVATAAGTSVEIFSSQGDPLGSFSIDQNREAPAIVLDSANGQLIATGFNQRDGGGCTQLQVPFIRAYSYSGEVRWRNYDWTHAEVAAVDECADSRGYGVSLGEDGKLYYAAESHGGNSVHRRMPKDLSTFAPNVKPDSYQDGYNMNGAAPMGYIARFDPATGDIETGSVFVVRLSDTKGNTLRPRDVAATADGHVIFTGASACCVENATERTVNGTLSMPEGTYGGGGFIMVLSPDFTERLTWTAFNGSSGGDNNGMRVASGSGAVAALFHQVVEEPEALSPLLTFDALQSTPAAGQTDSYLTVFRAP